LVAINKSGDREEGLPVKINLICGWLYKDQYLFDRNVIAV